MKPRNKSKKFGIRLVAMTGLILLILGGCGGAEEKVAGTDYERWMNPPAMVEQGVDAIVLPHHLLVRSFMEKFYGEVALKNKYKRVVIISPNHFGWGFNYIQTTDVINTNEKTIAGDARAMLADAPKLELDWIKKLADAKAAYIEPKLYSREHGVYTQYPFIKKYWPDATVVPIIIKHGTPQEKLDALVEVLGRLGNVEAGYTGGKSGTLFIFSLDFTHYTGENFAVRNDLRMMDWLSRIDKEDLSYQSAEEVGKSFDTSNADTVAVDSPESLYVLAKLIKGKGDTWNFWARTSSASMIKGLNPLDNTSHIFGYFTAK